MGLERYLFELACRPFPQWVLKAMRVVPLTNAVLGVLAPQGRIGGSGMKYRIRFIDSWILAKGVFAHPGGEYCSERFIAGVDKVQTVVDLGCNVGFFCLWVEYLRRAAGVRDSGLVGIAVDGNEHVLAEMSRNLKLNDINGIELVHGLAGGRKDGNGEFVYAQSTISSSGVAERRPSSMIGVRVKEVPFVDVGQMWERKEGSRRVDLLKIDIEGFEIDFILSNQDFMRRVDRLFIEWHKPAVQYDDVVRALGQPEWQMEILSEDSRFGVAYAWRRSEGGIA